MDPTPEPSPKPAPQPSAKPAEKPAAAPLPSAAGASARGPAEAYTAMPKFEKPPRRWGPLLAMLLLAAGAAGFGLRHHAQPIAAPAAIAAQTEQKVLAYSQRDFDQEATAAAKAILARNAQTHELEILAHETRGAEHSRPAQAPAPTPKEQAALALAAAPQALRADVASGKAGFYTFQLAALGDEGGDVYDIAVDGAPLMQITTSPQLKSITIPLDATKPHTVTHTLVFARPRAVYAKNGRGGPAPETGQASLAIHTSEGEAASRVTTPGQSESWTAQFHGGGQ